MVRAVNSPISGGYLSDGSHRSLAVSSGHGTFLYGRYYDFDHGTILCIPGVMWFQAVGGDFPSCGMISFFSDARNHTTILVFGGRSSSC